jgi:hypothetical protein
MSADNGVYVLRTFSNYVREGKAVRFVKEKFPEWRVAYASAIENFDFYENHQPENIGAYLVQVWKDSEVYESEAAAMLAANEIANAIKAAGEYLEYGVNLINTDYTFFRHY